jgi:Diguanylate cyclase, GGDEF domain
MRTHAASPAADLITVSSGGVVVQGCEGCDPADILRSADALLYQAKQRGRNRVVVQPFIWPPDRAGGVPIERAGMETRSALDSTARD